MCDVKGGVDREKGGMREREEEEERERERGQRHEARQSERDREQALAERRATEEGRSPRPKSP